MNSPERTVPGVVPMEGEDTKPVVAINRFEHREAGFDGSLVRQVEHTPLHPSLSRRRSCEYCKISIKGQKNDNQGMVMLCIFSTHSNLYIKTTTKSEKSGPEQQVITLITCTY